MRNIIRSFVGVIIGTLSSSVLAIPLGTVEVETKIGNQKLMFPVTHDLDIKTIPTGFEMSVITDMNLSSLQANIDSLAKTFPMPNNNCPSYGQHVLPKIESVSLKGTGGQAQLHSKINAVVWDCQKGIPLAGATLEWQTRCVKVFGTKMCTDVPVKLEPRPGPDIKNILIRDGVIADLSLTLVTKDKKSLELVPSNVKVEPRSDLLKFINEIAGLFNTNLSDIVQKEISKAVDAGILKQTLPKEFLKYNPELKNANFVSSPNGVLTAHVEFSALLSNEQLAEMIKQSINKQTTTP